MKKLNILLISLLTLTGFITAVSADAQPGYYSDANFNRFYNELSPYGRWVDMPRYGRVWIYSEPGFRPYSTNGQWVNTDMGWTWESGYEWGDIPFHYGRWELDPYYGWVWIPGYEYAPAWVMWSEADDYYGWAPLGFGMSINISIGRIPSNRWMYTQRGYMGYSRIDRYCVPYQRNSFYYQRQRPVGNIYTSRNVRYFGGPRFDSHNNNRNNYNSARPPVRTEQYGNNGGGRPNTNGGRDYNNGRDNNERDNNIHYDPSQYRRERAIGGQRPERSVTPEPAQERPNVEQRRVYSAPPSTPSRPEGRRPEYHNQPSGNSQPRINNENQSRPSAPVNRERSSNSGGRPPMTRNRSIH